MPVNDSPSWPRRPSRSCPPRASESTRSTSACRRFWIQPSTSFAADRTTRKESCAGRTDSEPTARLLLQLHQVRTRLVSRPVRRKNQYVSNCRWCHGKDDPQSPAFVREMIALVDDVGRVLNRFLRRIVLDLRERLVGETDLRRRLFAELQAHHLGA